MKRTKPVVKPDMSLVLNEERLRRIKTMEAIVLQGGLIGRTGLSSELGLQYGGVRDVYRALGYKKDLYFKDYVARYLRQDMAKAVINRPIDATWRGTVNIEESDDERVTGLEKGWKDLYSKLSLKNIFIRLDKLASIGRWGVLLLGFDDAQDSNDLSQPVRSGKRQLVYLKPLSEESAKVATWEQNAGSDRYGLPLTYNISTIHPTGSITQALVVHYSRVIHVPGELLESEIEGVPVLQSVYNRLMDLEKLVGASAEMFWRGARPGYTGKISEGFQLTPQAQALLEEQINEYENNLRRFLINEGLDLEALAMQVADPLNHLDIQLQMISSVTGIPKRILVGSERGELASSEDRMAWLELIQARREDYAEAQIIRPFVKRCQEYNILPPGKQDYKILWSDIFAPSEKERAQIGQIRASALQSYMNNPAAAEVIPPEVFYELMLGLDRAGIDRVKMLHEKAMSEEGISFRDLLPISGEQGERTQSQQTQPQRRQQRLPLAASE